MRDRRSGRYLAATTSPFYGPKIWIADDVGGEWEQAEGVGLPEDGEETLSADLGDRPGRGGRRALRGRRPGRALREPGRRRLVDAQRGPVGASDTPRLASGQRRAVPAHDRAVARRSTAAARRDLGRRRLADRGRGHDVAARERRHRPALLPDDARDNPIQHCVHDVRRSAARPERLFMQFHDGVYRSDDGGEHWIEIATGTALPSDFGFPVVVDPADPDSAYVIPLVGAMDRTTPGGAVGVWETRDAGADVEPRAATGCPASDAYLDGPARGVRLRRRGNGRSSSTSARPRATSSARATRAPRGRRSPTTCRPCTPYGLRDRVEPRAGPKLDAGSLDAMGVGLQPDARFALTERAVSRRTRRVDPLGRDPHRHALLARACATGRCPRRGTSSPAVDLRVGALVDELGATADGDPLIRVRQGRRRQRSADPLAMFPSWRDRARC